MTTLLQRCQNLDSRLAGLTLAKRHEADVLLIQRRSEEWEERKSKRNRVESNSRLLVLATVDAIALASKRKTLRQHAATVLARLEDDHDIKELTRDSAWTKLLKSSDSYSEALDAAARRAWSALLEQRGTLESPAVLRLRTPLTPQNAEALRSYERSYASYAVIAARPLPSAPDDLTQLDAHITACKTAYSRLTFDLPAEVRAFFDALQSDAASLAHVTPAVLLWLEEQHQLERFRVQSAKP